MSNTKERRNLTLTPQCIEYIKEQQQEHDHAYKFSAMVEFIIRDYKRIKEESNNA